MHKVVTGDAILIFDMDKKQNENVIYIVSTGSNCKIGEVLILSQR